MVDNPKKGTGDKLGTIELGNGHKIEVFDDGDSDLHNKWDASWNENGGHRSNLSQFVRDIRRDFGDEAAMNMLGGRSGNPTTSDASSTASSDEPRSSDYIGRSSFKCDDCSKTFPYNKTYCPDPGRDVCDGCSS